MKLLVPILLTLCFLTNPKVIKAQENTSTKPHPNAFVAIDIFNPVLGIFTPKMGIEGLITYRISKKIHLATEIGCEKNQYIQNQWDIDAKGLFARLGAQYFISQDVKNINNGYYIGGRIGFSPFQQTFNSFKIIGADNEMILGSLPQHNTTVFWFEPLAGGRVQLWNSAFYTDASVRLKIKLFGFSDYDVDTMIIPGFGTDQSGLGFGINWSIGYALPF